MKYLPVIVLLVSAFRIGAQDLHYSQSYLNPMHITPAATGMFEGDLRCSGLYRSQWRSVPVDYRTFSGAAEWKAFERASNRLSLGLQLQQDRAGDAGLSWLQIGLNFGAAHKLSQTQRISAGFGLALIQRKFDIGGLTFKNQWGGDAFNAGLPTGEQFNRASGMAPSLSAGLMWQFKAGEARSKIDLGGGISHLNQPVVSLGDFENSLPSRISFVGFGLFQIHYLYDIVIFSEWQKMAQARETVVGAGIRRILTTGLANETNVQLTLAHRLGDAIIPAIQFERNNWLVGISYDWNISSFDTASRGRGGMEIAVIWRKIPVPALKTVKSCPPF